MQHLYKVFFLIVYAVGKKVIVEFNCSKHSIVERFTWEPVVYRLFKVYTVSQLEQTQTNLRKRYARRTKLQNRSGTRSRALVSNWNFISIEIQKTSSWAKSLIRKVIVRTLLGTPLTMLNWMELFLCQLINREEFFYRGLMLFAEKLRAKIDDEFLVLLRYYISTRCFQTDNYIFIGCSLRNSKTV